VTYKLLKHKNLPDPYIRMARFFDNGQYLVLCTRKEQTELFAKSLYAEIDMAFKRIYSITNEWEICAYTLVFARAFTNIQSANAYQHLFEDLFAIVENDTQKPFKFQHIHDSGLGCLIADAHQGQVLAISNEIKTLMYSIPTLKTQKQIFETLNKIKESDWVQDKYKSWVLAGLSLAFTKMDIEIWNQTPNNTNANESAHANINYDDHSLSLLAAIYRGDDFDQRQWHTAKTYEQYNVQDSYKNKSELACLTYNAKRS
ncbi:14953_t:CDS:2, partial [Cetraspora pellucida]